MWADAAKTRAAKAVARMVTSYVSSDRIMGTLERLQHVRTLVDEGASAVWHFGAMPSRYDVRVLMRRTANLRRRVAELDQALARLERAIDAREKKRSAATTSAPASDGS
jgi:hypothetical protein